jgi:hypothetical protein
MNAHMNRVLADQYATELREVADRQRLARAARRPGAGARLMAALRRDAAPNGRPAAAPKATAATPAGCAPEQL